MAIKLSHLANLLSVLETSDLKIRGADIVSLAMSKEAISIAVGQIIKSGADANTMVEIKVVEEKKPEKK
jgi:hypothetical protein